MARRDRATAHRRLSSPPIDVVVVGAGTFGASLAWWLARTGERVTLVDQLEPGDRRASSGGETRLYRCGHGSDSDYTVMARRARTLWRELEEEAGEELFVGCGLAWFAHRADGWEAESERTLSAHGIPVERLDVTAAAALFPSFRGDDLASVLLEPGPASSGPSAPSERWRPRRRATARGSCARGRGPNAARAALEDDSAALEGDVVVWAGGPWLTRLFPELVSLKVTRQELRFFDGGPDWRSAGVPAWCDYDRARYGTADVDACGVKAAVDDEGPLVDPDAELPEERTTEPEVRTYLRDRFLALELAPLLAARSCRYELTPDTHFIAAPHPEHPSVWLVGGGSGHGFKHGPAVAERLARAFREGAPLPARFGLGVREPSRSMRTAGSGLPRS